MIGWQPIASAPRDGRLVLLYWPNYAYHEGNDCGEVIEIGRWKNNMRTGKSYFSDTNEMDDYGLATCAPTNWMPLPSPPEEGE